jgi:hypothetical protein
MAAIVVPSKKDILPVTEYSPGWELRGWRWRLVVLFLCDETFFK